MIKSMTGFGRCEIQQDSKKFTVELKSVNHRYLDVNIRMPKKLNFFETSIRTLLKSYANRGKVDIFITYEDLSQAQSSVKYNPLIAAEYMKYLSEEYPVLYCKALINNPFDTRSKSEKDKCYLKEYKKQYKDN